MKTSLRSSARWTALLLTLAAGAASLTGSAAAADPVADRKFETVALAPDAPWRVYAVCAQQERGRRGANPPAYTPAPAANWAAADFDASGWGRYGADWAADLGGYGYGQAASNSALCLRNNFAVTDPAAVRDLTLSLEYRGGAVVYVNGQEVARGNLPEGKIALTAPAEAYPPEVFTDDKGDPLPQADRPAQENLERYEKRIRKLTVAIPATALRKGANVLAVELHAAPPGKGAPGKNGEWSTVGLCGARLEANGGASAYAEALRGITVSNATAMDIIATTPGKRQAGFLWNGVTVTPAGLTRPNPFEPLTPIRTVAPRGGTCSGQVVVSGPGPIRGLKASLSTLQRTDGGETLPASAVRVAFAHQSKAQSYCDELQPQPAEGAPVQPVWVLVDVPRDQAPGWYTGTLTLTAGGHKTEVPVQVQVASWTLTDPRNNATLVSMYQSPDTLVDQYKVEPWSDQHFALIEKSMRSMAELGDDVLLVPVVLDNYLHHKTGLVRWVKKGNGYEPEFSAFERYLDLQTKVWGKPKVVTLSIWKHDFGTRSWFRGMKSEVVKPASVTELDPATGKMKPMKAPGFDEPGSEEFWKPAIDGVRRIAKAHGIDERFVLLGEAFDSRPLEKHRQFFEKIEPGMRWQVYSHFDGGEPAPKDGKFVCLGGFEVGFRIGPNGGGLEELVPARSKGAPTKAAEYLSAQAERTLIFENSSPLSYRLVMGHSGTLARIGLDFWPIMTDERGRIRSYYGCPPNEGWLWRGHVPSITAAGPDGAVRTVRGQNLLEGLQETEARVALIRAKAKAKPETAARIDAGLTRYQQALAVGRNLSQAMISMDLPAMAAEEYTLAAELAGEPIHGTWSSPPAPSASLGASR